MRIAVFGGTGRTGQWFISKALESGHALAILARSPAKLDIQHARLVVQQGDALDQAAVARVMAGADAVVCLLAPAKGQAPFSVTHSLENILAGMRKHGIQRLVMTAGAGVADPLDRATLMSRLMGAALKAAARDVYEDMLAAVQRVRASDLEWTVVRAPMLHDGPALGDVKAGYLGGGAGSRISRADLAAFVLEQLSTDKYLYAAPVVSN